MKHWVAFFLLLVGVPVCAHAHGNNATTDTHKVAVTIRPLYNGKTLNAGDRLVSPHGDTFYVDALRFYISNIGFTEDHNALQANSHLFDLEDANTYSFVISNIPAGSYTTMHLLAGVDSAANTSGANGGDLDPARGMYWAWNSGYIMAKLEGHSSACQTVHHAFEFHIGGYMPPYNTERAVTLKIPVSINIGVKAMPRISITANVAAWFGDDLDLAKVNSIMIPGKDAAMMADKYAKMFSVENVTYTPLTK